MATVGRNATPEGCRWDVTEWGREGGLVVWRCNSLILLPVLESFRESQEIP